jgi:hypothetical protein
MSNLEQFVRPFQTKDVTPPRRVITEGADVAPVAISIGTVGSNLTFLLNLFISTGFETEDERTHIEVNRTTVDRRVENPDDSEQYVTVRDTEKIKLRKKSDPTDYRIYEFNNEQI